MKGLRLALIAGALAAAFLLSSSEALADKLVLFKNGKVMRVKSAQSGKNWTTLNLGKENVMGVPNTQIVGIEEAEATTVGRAGSALPNQATVTGRGGGGRGGGRGRPQAFNRSGQPAGTPQEDQDDGEEMDDQSEQTGAVVGRDVGPRRRGANNRATPGVSGVRSLQENLQQLNQQTGSQRFRSGSRSSSFNRRAKGSQGGSPASNR